MTADLRTALDEYLKLRRGLGFSLARDEKLLGQFLGYLNQLGHASITIDDALAWAKLPEPASPGWLGMRLSVVRSFAAYLHKPIDVRLLPDLVRSLAASTTVTRRTARG